MIKINLRFKYNTPVIIIILCNINLTWALNFENKPMLNSNSNLWTNWILVRSPKTENIENEINTNQYPIATYNENDNKDLYTDITPYLNPSVEVYAISGNLMKDNLNLISNDTNSLQNEINKNDVNKYPALNWLLDRFRYIFQTIEKINNNDSSISKLLNELNENDNMESVGEARKKIGKKYKKMLLPLLLAYKLKFFTLIPVLMGGLILLVGTTGAAGFFFALFAAVMSLRPHDH